MLSLRRYAEIKDINSSTTILISTSLSEQIQRFFGITLKSKEAAKQKKMTAAVMEDFSVS